MTKPIIKIVNATTGKEIEREMNAEELAQWEADKVSAAAEKQAKQEAEAQRQALLERLGITEEEAKLLLS
jgi:hypothetical protein